MSINDVKTFISHRHTDQGIADVLFNHLQDWGIPKENIFQSSNVQSGPRIGGQLNEELSEKLRGVNLFFLIYTFNDEDWLYCMYECGIVEGKDTLPTRVIVIQCMDDVPKVFHDVVRVEVKLNDIKRLANQFHTDDDFVPIEGTALHDGIADEIVDQRATGVFTDLSEQIPEGQSTSQHIWDFLRLRLEPEVLVLE